MKKVVQAVSLCAVSSFATTSGKMRPFSRNRLFVLEVDIGMWSAGRSQIKKQKIVLLQEAVVTNSFRSGKVRLRFP